MNFIVHPEAAFEAIEARTWYSESSDQKGRDFSQALESAFDLIHGFPRAGVIVQAGHRRVLVHGYPYSVIYYVRTDAVVIVAIAHTSREPGYWRGRR